MTDTGPTIADVDVVLVVGPMRTGTTLVAELLASRPDVAYLGFELSEQWAGWTGLPWAAPGADDRTCPALSAAEATPERVTAVREGLTDLLREQVGPAAPPETVVLKNPHLWHRLPFVAEVLPRPRVVRTRRDRRATVASLRRLWDRSLAQHDHVHHLPRDPDRCWDYVPTGEVHDLDPQRTFPGGDVAVLAEFLDRAEARLDATAKAAPELVDAEVAHEDLVRDLEETATRLQRDLGLDPVPLIPPEPLDPARLDEWRTLLSEDELRRL